LAGGSIHGRYARSSRRARAWRMVMKWKAAR
jgi:hypothetical protein